MPTSPVETRSYQLFMLSLCVYALLALAVSSIVPADSETQRLLAHADTFVCLLFFADFLLSLYRAERRLRYFFTWGWLDLLSSIPLLDVGRWGRAARIVRILRVLRGVRATRVLAGAVLEQRAQSGILAAALVTLLLIVISGISVLQVESVPASNILTAEDALWWALTTITTVGYGDHYPVTFEGRLVAGVLMCAGVGLFGTFSGFVAAWFVEPSRADRDLELQHLREEIRQLRRLVERSNAGQPLGSAE